MNMREYLADWLLIHCADLKPRTAEQYNSLSKRYIMPVIGDICVEDLVEHDIRHVLAPIIGSGHTRTAELVYVIIRAALGDLHRSDLMREIKRPHHRQHSPRPWSDADMRTYVSALWSHPHGLALSLGVLLGMRRGEICGLRWGDIDFANAEVHVCNQRVRLATGKIIDTTPKSETSERYIPVPEALLSRLYAARGLPTAYVDGISPEGLSKAHRKLVASLALRYIPLHGLRHSFATSCVRHGADMRVLQIIMGHSSYYITANRYTQPDCEMLRSMMTNAYDACYNIQCNTAVH